MIAGKRVMVVLPAYNAAPTLEATYQEIPFEVVDDVILVDDASRDDTVAIAEKLGIRHIIRHDHNLALDLEADIVVMLHPDYQYTPRLIPAMASIIAHDIYPVVYASRILGKGALRGGMPLYKYVANRLLTLFQNILMNQKLSEYHTGYRAFSREVLESLDFSANSNDFVFDNQMTAQVFYAGYEIAEVTCPTKYFEEASSINLSRSTVYGLGVIKTSFQYFLQKLGLVKVPIFERLKAKK